MYIDTSLLVPYYYPEPLSETAQRRIRGDSRPMVSDLVEVEFFSALAKKVREKAASAIDAGKIGEQFLAHLHGGMYTRIAMQRRHYEIARELLARFTLPLRAPDALHLALAEAEGLHLATADLDLFRSARSVGVAATLVRT